MVEASEIYKLWRLQKIDLERIKLLRRLEQPKNQEAHNTALAAAKQVLRKLKVVDTTNDELHKQVRRGELELATLEAQIKDLEATLYGGAVTNSRELAGLEKKLASVRTSRTKQEEELLTAMQSYEAVQVTATEARQLAQKFTREYKVKQAALDKEVGELQELLAEVNRQRQEVAATIRPEWLTRYEKLSQQRSEVVAMVEGNACSACRLSLPAHLVTLAANHSTPAYCEGCGRLLFVP